MVNTGEYNATSTLKVSTNTGKVQVKKIDSENAKPIEGVTFELLKSDGTKIGTAKTNAEGIVTFSNLYQGNYKLRETATNKEYILNSKEFDVLVEYNKTAIKEITNNHKKGNLKINKTDKDTSKPISGVTFQLLDLSGNVVTSGTTNNNGELYFDNLRIGKYKLKEVSTNKNYVLNKTVFDVDIEYNKTITKNITNEYKKGHIKINKTDDETKEGIEGVKFALIDISGNTIATATTNKNGIANFNNIRIGHYKLKELSTNDKYILNDKIFGVDVEYEKTTVKEITNEHKKGNLNLYKVDKDNHKIALGNVQFDLFSKEFNKVIGTYTTDVNGELKIDNLRIGNYEIIEKNTGKWYELTDNVKISINWNETTDIIIENELKKGQIKLIKIDKDHNEVRLAGVEFEVLDEDNNVLERIVTDYKGEAITNRYAIRDFPKLKLHEIRSLDEYELSTEVKTIELKANEITSINFENEKKKGQIRVIKVDLDDNTIGLPGVIFEIMDEEGNIVDTIITNEKGEATSKMLLSDKEYKVIEKETLEDYILEEKPQMITVEANKVKDAIFQNELRKGQVKLIKVDKEKNELKLEGVEFEILDENDNLLEKVVTDENGEALTKRYPLNNFSKIKIRESKAAKGYALSEETKVAELKEGEVIPIYFENEVIRGNIEITKVSKDDNKITGEKKGTLLEGAVFEIYTEDGELIDTVTTKKDGKAFSKELVYGIYYIKEKSTGSNNYLLNGEKYKVEIKEHKKIVSIIIENKSVTPPVKKLPKTGF